MLKYMLFSFWRPPFQKRQVSFFSFFLFLHSNPLSVKENYVMLSVSIFGGLPYPTRLQFLSCNVEVFTGIPTFIFRGLM